MNTSEEPLWPWRALQAACNGRWHGQLPDALAGASSVAIDSRALDGGALFFALPGDLSHRFHVSSASGRDGHEFVAAAAAAGAAAAVVSRPAAVDLPQLVVNDTVDALWALGRAGRQRHVGRAVSVTGSSGKTTFKTMLAEALDAFATGGSLNNHLGVPITLASIPPHAAFAVVEIGTSSPGEIAPLARLAAADVAVLLNVQLAHIENFPDQAALRAEKGEIVAGLEPGGAFVVHDALGMDAPELCRRLRFGDSAEADVRLRSVTGDLGTFEVLGHTVEARVPGGGWHRGLTLAAVMASLLALELPVDAALRLSDTAVPQGRGGAVQVGGVTVIDDSYNANPDSMRAALHTLAGWPGARRLAIVGEMLELGDEAPEQHRRLQQPLGALEGFWLVGPGTKSVPDLPGLLGRSAEADETLLTEVLQTVGAGDVVLIKGSNRVFWAKGFARRLQQALSERQ